MLKTVLYFILIIGFMAGFPLWLAYSHRKEEALRQAGKIIPPSKHKKAKIIVIVFIIFLFSLFLAGGTSSYEELDCRRATNTCAYTSYNLHGQKKTIEIPLNMDIKAYFYKEKVSRNNREMCGFDWAENPTCYDYLFYVVLSSKRDLKMFLEKSSPTLSDMTASRYQKLVGKINNFMRSSAPLFHTYRGEKTDRGMTVLMFLIVYGFLGLVMYLIARKKKEPKDVFCSPKTSRIEQTDDAILSHYQHLEFYSLYRWAYHKKETNGFFNKMSKVWSYLSVLTDKFPKIFEFIFLFTSVIVRFLSSGHRSRGFWDRMETLKPPERNISIIEMCVFCSLILIVCDIVAALNYLFSLSVGGTIITLVILILLFGNIVYCFKKLDKEIDKNNGISETEYQKKYYS